MGAGASSNVNSEAITAFKEAVEWYGKGEERKNDNELAEFLQKGAVKVLGDSNTGKGGSSNGKEDDVRGAADTNDKQQTQVLSTSPSESSPVEWFEDSVYHKEFLTPAESESLFNHLKEIGEANRPRTTADTKSLKYPLWCLYYGFKRKKDGAIALDRWGSYHESWCRIEEPTPELASCCAKIRAYFNLHPESINSITVNYYFDGDSTFIPAHRDTVACLEEGSRVNIISLGATRSFCLTPNEDTGKHVKEDMNVVREWRVGHGDFFALGQRTNERYNHAVPQESGLQGMRISVVFRTISKSFINLEGPEKEVVYASGNVKKFRAECIKTRDFLDEGTKEHIADLIAEREDKKKRLREQKKAEADAKGAGTVPEVNKLLHLEDNSKYFMGEGTTVPLELFNIT